MHNCFPFTPNIIEYHTTTPNELRMYPIDFGIQRLKVKVTVHWLLKIVWFMLHILFAFTPIIMNLHIQTSHELRMSPVYFGIQMSRSQCIDNWKWFLVHNYFPFTLTIMKLHTKTPHESRICPYDWDKKNPWVWIGCRGICPIRTAPF